MPLSLKVINVGSWIYWSIKFYSICGVSFLFGHYCTYSNMSSRIRHLVHWLGDWAVWVVGPESIMRLWAGRGGFPSKRQLTQVWIFPFKLVSFPHLSTFTTQAQQLHCNYWSCIWIKDEWMNFYLLILLNTSLLESSLSFQMAISYVCTLATSMSIKLSSEQLHVSTNVLHLHISK